MIIWLILRNAQAKPLFEIRFSSDGSRVRSGAANREFLHAVKEIAAQHQLKRGRIRGFPAPAKAVRPEISRNVPPLAAQQLRNAYGVSV